MHCFSEMCVHTSSTKKEDGKDTVRKTYNRLLMVNEKLITELRTFSAAYVRRKALMK